MTYHVPSLFAVALSTVLLAQDPPAGAGKPATPPAPAAADAGRELLQKSLRFLQSLPAFTGKATATMVMPELPDGIEIDAGELPTVDVEVCVALPDRFALRAGEPFGGEVVSDGKRMLRSMAMVELYSVGEAPKSAVEFLGKKGALVDLPGQQLLARLLAPSGSKRALIDSKKVKVLADEKVGKRECHHLAIEDDGAVAEVWIQKGDEPYVLRHKPAPAKLDMEALMNGGGEGEEGEAGEDGAMTLSLAPGFDIEFTEVGKEPAKDAFAIVEPEGAEKVDDLDAAVRAKFEEEMGGMELEDVTDANEAAGQHESVGKPAPDVAFTLLDGTTQKLADLKGKVVVLDFWATWCGPCVQGLPKVAEVTGKRKDEGVVFVAVNLGESQEKVAAFLADKKLAITVALADDALGAKFGVNGIPHTVVIGKDGTVQAVHVGFGPGGEQRLDADVVKALGGGKPAKEEKKDEKKDADGKQVEPPKPAEKKVEPKKDGAK